MVRKSPENDVESDVVVTLPFPALKAFDSTVHSAAWGQPVVQAD